jgi:hypothetical protein
MGWVQNLNEREKSSLIKPARNSMNSDEEVDIRLRTQDLLHARSCTIEAALLFRSRLREGMTEIEGRQLALECSYEVGAIQKKHWHQPFVRFGEGTLETYAKSLSSERRLRKGDPVYVDLGPVFLSGDGLEVEGDFGDTFVLGENLEATFLIEKVHALFHRTREAWLEGHLSGENLYGFLANQANAMECEIIPTVDGHRISEFPHQKHSKTGLGEFHGVPNPDRWILEIQIRHLTLPMGAFYEDLLSKDSAWGFRSLSI